MPTITKLIKDFKDEKLNSPSTQLNQPFAYSLDAKKEYQLGDNATIKLGGEAGADVLLLNESNKTDAALDTERVFDLPREESDNSFQVLSFKPLISFGDHAAWLRYRLYARASASVDTTRAPVGITLDANTEASASYYKKHALKNNAGQDVTIGDVLLGGIPEDPSLEEAPELAKQAGKQLLKLPNIFEKDAAVNNMAVGDALSLRVAGGLDLGVKVNLTELLSGAVAGSGVFTGLLSVKYSAGVNFTASAAVTDEFILIIAKSTSNRYDVAYRKSESRRLSAGASVGVNVDLDDSKIQKLADEAIASAAEVGTSTISRLYNDVDQAIEAGEAEILQYLGGLPPKTVQALDNLLPKLVEAPFEKLSDILHEPGEIVLDKIKNLKTALETSKEKLFDSFKTKGKRTLEISIGLEYSRISANRDILRFNCNETVLNKIRKDLYRMDLKRTRAAIEKAEKTNSNEIELTSYLREKSLTKHSTFSIGFTLLAWSVKNARTTKIRRNILEDLSVAPPAPIPILKVAYETTRSVAQESTRLGETYAVSFGAQSLGNARHPDGPTTDELEYSLGAAATYKATTLSNPGNVMEYLDTGLIYGALTNTDLDTAAQKLFNQLKDSAAPNSRISVNTGVTVKGELSRMVLRKIAAKDHRIIAQACARAMTRLDLFPTRSVMSLREKGYTPIFQDYFERDRSNGALRELLYSHLVGESEALAKFEKYYADGNRNTRGYLKSNAHMDYFLGVVTKYRRRSPRTGNLTVQSANDVLRDGVINMSDAAQALIDSWASGSSFRIIEDRIHQQLLDLWENEFNGRFFGAYLNLIVQELRKKHSPEFETLFRINFTNKQKKDDHIDLITAY